MQDARLRLVEDGREKSSTMSDKYRELSLSQDLVKIDHDLSLFGSVLNQLDAGHQEQSSRGDELVVVVVLVIVHIKFIKNVENLLNMK